MNNAELYQKSNALHWRDVRHMLEEYTGKIEWNSNGATVIDIGCGDGGVTTGVLKSYIPNNFKKLVGCDISEKMIEFANAHHANDSISFMVLDLESDLPEKLCEKFDHAFSFYAINWMIQQEIVFSNIYNLLTNGGGCLLMFVGSNPVFVVYRELARSPRWNRWVNDVDRFVSPYHDSQDPEKDIKTMMTSIGFTQVEIKCEQKEFVFESIEAFKNLMSAISPFEIPLELQEDFFKDYIQVFRNMGLEDHVKSNVDGQFKLKLVYNCIIAYGKK